MTNFDQYESDIDCSKADYARDEYIDRLSWRGEIHHAYNDTIDELERRDCEMAEWLEDDAIERVCNMGGF